MSKIGIIGMGHVGSHVAFSLLSNGLCDELVLIDINKEKAIAHGYDLMDNVYYPKKVKFYFNDYSKLDDCDILIISVAGDLVSESRLFETKYSIMCVDEVINNLTKTKFNGIILSITNPCDVIANYIKLKTNYNVIGGGTTLDSSRLKVLISDLVCSSNLENAYMLGEHGDSQFAYFSGLKINNKSIYEYNLDLVKLENDIRFRATPIFNFKGCTEFAIGACAAKLVDTILNNKLEVFPVSHLVNRYNISSYVSLPCVIGRCGVIEEVNIKLSKDEEEALKNSMEIINSYVSKYC